MRAATKKLTTAAVCTALAVIMCVATAYLPLSFMPLYLAAFCIFLACKRGNLVYGILCALASVGLMFLMTGLTVKWFVFVLMFAPYGILTYFMSKLTYFKWKTALVRVVIAIAYFNLTFGCLFLVATRLLPMDTGDINIVAWGGKLGGYAVLALVATVILVPLDFIFSTLSMVVLKRLPSADGKKEKPVDWKKPDGRVEEKKDEKKYDIFGYEIIDKDKTDDGSE